MVMGVHKVLVGNPAVSPPVHEAFLPGDLVTDLNGNVLAALSTEVITVAKSGAMFTSVKEGVDYGALLITPTTPVRVDVGPGIYDEDPFTIPTGMKVQGAGWQTTILRSNDLANHFIEVGAGSVFRDCAVLGPTAFGKACIHHAASDPRPASITEVVFSRGYYGILSNPMVSRGPLLAQLVSFSFGGTAMQNFIRAEGYADVIASQCLAVGPDNQIVEGYVASGANAGITLVVCDFECGGATDAVFVDDSAFARLVSCLLVHGGNAIHVGSSGAPVVIAHGTTIQNTPTTGFAKDIFIETASATVHFSGSATRENFDNAVGADFTASGADVTPGEEGAFTLGESRIGTDPLKMLPMGSYAKACFLTGIIVGGYVTRGAGRVLNVSLGYGFINDGSDPVAVVWGPGQTVTIAAGKTEYVYVDATGTAQHSEVQPDYSTNIILAQAVADATDIVLLTQDEIQIAHSVSRTQEYFEDVIGPINITGAFTSADAIPLRLDVSDGEFVVGLSERPVTGASPITFTLVHHDALGGWTFTPGQTTLGDTSYDGGTGPTPMTGGKYRKDCLYVVVNQTTTEFFVVMGQQEFLAADVPNGALPVPPEILQHYAMRSGAISILKSAGAINAIYDVRPTIGQNAASSGGIAGDHDLLTHLDHDTHLQYLTAARAVAWLALQAGNTTNLVTNGNNHDHTGGAGAQIDHTTLSNKGTMTHAALELLLNGHVADTANPHAVTKSQVGLSAVTNDAQIPLTQKAAASGVASLDGSSKVVQDPANATATPTVGKIPIAGVGGTLDPWVTQDAAAATSSMRKLGTGATDACAGNDARLSDARTPAAHQASHISGADQLPVATTSVKGLESAADKLKLDGIATGATANVFGNDYQEAHDDARTTNNTTTWTNGNKVTLTTPALTGRYRIGWGALLDHSATNSNAEARLWDNTAGAMLGQADVLRPTNAAERIPCGGRAHDVVFTGASKTFILQFRAATAGTAGCSDARLELYRVQ